MCGNEPISPDRGANIEPITQYEPVTSDGLVVDQEQPAAGPEFRDIDDEKMRLFADAVFGECIFLGFVSSMVKTLAFVTEAVVITYGTKYN